MSKVRKAVIPAAGYGTRLLPITKTVSKEMLPLVDKPIIQVVVEELVEAGVEDIIIVITDQKTDIADYFGEVKPGLVSQLDGGKLSKRALLADLDQLKHLAHFTFVNQLPGDTYGTGTPVLRAKPYLGEEPFIYAFADDFFMGQPNSYLQMIEAYERYCLPVVACQKRTADEDYMRYGYIGGTELQPGEIDVHAFIEHPSKENKPGDLASFGGFIVTPEVLPYLETVQATLPAGKEFYFNSALGLMIQDNKRLIAKEIEGQYCDTGNKLDYMKSCVAIAADHPEIGAQFNQFLKQFLAERGL